MTEWGTRYVFQHMLGLARVPLTVLLLRYFLFLEDIFLQHGGFLQKNSSCRNICNFTRI